MKKQTKIGAGIAGGFLSVLVAMTCFPLLSLGTGTGGAAPCGPKVADDGTPSILGPSTLSAADLQAWWAATHKGQPPRLELPIDDVTALYIGEGDAEGIRGDIAFAQAVLETGSFTNRDTAINNFAGIAHYDNAASGAGFPDAITGVRAQIQLLKKFAAGNHAPLAHPEVSPNAGATATTWGALTGTWATSSSYWPQIQKVYQSMVKHAASDATSPTSGGGSTTLPSRCTPELGSAVAAGGYVLPVERRWYDQHPGWFTKPHHDYPAADIPVPTGTPLYAVTNGTLASTPTSGKCGIGVVLNGNDGAQYTYCHGLPGTQTVSTGDRVTGGQRLLTSDSTGNSTGPHLHFGIRINGQNLCPQTFLVSIASGKALDPHGLPAAGCTS